MAESNAIVALAAELDELRASNEELKESLDSAMLSLRIENVGWNQILGGSGEDIEGPSLDELQELSKKIRPHVAVTGLISRGLELHSGYVWGRGMDIEGSERPSGSRGTQTALQRFVSNPVNKESLFSASAHKALQSTRYSDGMVLALCNTSNQTVRIIPFSEITDVKVNPDFPSEVWAYQRTWNPEGNSVRSSDKTRVRWIYTHRFPNVRQASYGEGAQRVAVEPNATIVDFKANSQTGWVLGIPDAAPALPHYSAYMKAVNEGKIVTESRAKLLLKIVSKTPAGAANASAKVAGMKGVGNAASFTDGSDVSILSGSEKGYDFQSLDRLAGLIASALNVPLIELMANSAFAGSSYGAAQAIGPATINTMRLIQEEWIGWYREIFDVFGIKVGEISFPPIQEPDAYRVMQERVLAWNTGLVHEDEMRPELLTLLQIPSKHADAPDGVLLPNNEYSEARTDIDPNGASYSGPDSNNRTSTTPSPDQGVGNGANGSDSTQRNDLRSDGIGEVLRGMQIETLKDLTERLEFVLANLPQNN